MPLLRVPFLLSVLLSVAAAEETATELFSDHQSDLFQRAEEVSTSFLTRESSHGKTLFNSSEKSSSRGHLRGTIKLRSERRKRQRAEAEGAATASSKRKNGASNQSSTARLSELFTRMTENAYALGHAAAQKGRETQNRLYDFYARKLENSKTQSRSRERLSIKRTWQSLKEKGRTAHEKLYRVWSGQVMKMHERLYDFFKESFGGEKTSAVTAVIPPAPAAVVVPDTTVKVEDPNSNISLGGCCDVSVLDLRWVGVTFPTMVLGGLYYSSEESDEAACIQIAGCLALSVLLLGLLLLCVILCGGGKG